MRMIMFSIYDKRAAVYLVPFPARSQIAQRQIVSSFDNPHMRETPIMKHPTDFTLMEIGTFDDESGIMTCQNPTIVAEIRDLAARAQLDS